MSRVALLAFSLIFVFLMVFAVLILRENYQAQRKKLFSPAHWPLWSALLSTGNGHLTTLAEEVVILKRPDALFIPRPASNSSSARYSHALTWMIVLQKW